MTAHLRPVSHGIVAALELSAGGLAEVLQIEQRAFSHPWGWADFEGVARDSRSVTVGLRLDERLAGYAIGTVDRGTFHLLSLAVDGDCRRRGVGSRLLAASLERARRRGCRRCRLEVRRTNEAALQMYRKSGFTLEGVRRRFYTDPVEDAWLLGCVLELCDDPTRGSAGAGHRRR